MLFREDEVMWLCPQVIAYTYSGHKRGCCGHDSGYGILHETTSSCWLGEKR